LDSLSPNPKSRSPQRTPCRERKPRLSSRLAASDCACPTGTRKYTETKETLGGILLLEARDLNHAIALMSKHPAARIWPTTFEIRPANEAMNRLVAERSAAVAKEA
jgi:YCII-related domain